MIYIFVEITYYKRKTICSFFGLGGDFKTYVLNSIIIFI
jgi:hypothetical protein